MQGDVSAAFEKFVDQKWSDSLNIAASDLYATMIGAANEILYMWMTMNGLKNMIMSCLYKTNACDFEQIWSMKNYCF
jgi:beta-galactosidase GanA